MLWCLVKTCEGIFKSPYLLWFGDNTFRIYYFCTMIIHLPKCCCLLIWLNTPRYNYIPATDWVTWKVRWLLHILIFSANIMIHFRCHTLFPFATFWILWRQSEYSQGWFLTIFDVSFECPAPKVGHLISP